MAYKTANRVLETSTTTGTGTFTLSGAVALHVTFASVLTNGDIVHYRIDEVDAVGRPNGAWEVGRGTYSAGTLARTTFVASSTGSAVSFAVGPKIVGITVLAPTTTALRADWRSALGLGDRPSMINMLDNGDFAINQRNTASTTVSAYLADRWNIQLQSTRMSAAMFASGSAPAAPTGVFQSALRLGTASAGSPSASEYYFVCQTIEGVRLGALPFGAGVSGYFLTLGFWIRSSVIGTYGVSIRNGTSTRSYITTVTTTTINWEYKTVTFPVDTAGTWDLTTAAAGLSVAITAASGTTYQTATLNAWQAGNYLTSSSQAQVCATASATLDITGVQLEPGLYASPFEFIPIGMAMPQLQRYFEIVAGVAVSGQDLYSPWFFKAVKRATPTVTLLTGIFAGASTSVDNQKFYCPDNVTPTSTSGWQASFSADI